jgi:hypothetical protein
MLEVEDDNMNARRLTEEETLLLFATILDKDSF